MANENRSIKYTRYAIGEIVLVVVGILIALSINTWNTKNKERTNIDNYYHRIYQEIEVSLKEISRFEKNVDTFISLNKRSLQILNLKNKDSLYLLNESLGALGIDGRANFTFPVIDEFLDQGYIAKIKNDSIKIHIQQFGKGMKHINELDNYVHSQYYTTIEPYFNKHINYANVVYGNMANELIKGGPKTNYLKFENNLELWNILTFKLETLISQKQGAMRLQELLYNLNKHIAQEIQLQTINFE